MNGRPVLVQVDLSIHPGEIVALTGTNGAGKTTLLRCLAGRLRPGAGEVLWFGQSPMPALHHLIGFSAHQPQIYPDLTASENLLFAARMCAIARPRVRVVELLATTGLARVANQAAGRLSQGLSQRLSLARALIHDPPIAILDEPFAGLDAAGRDWLVHWLCELRTRRRAIIFSTHDDEQSRSLADRTLELVTSRSTITADTAGFSLSRSA
jgi:heme ABC exporter ATP-binding subunit CcmA